MKTFIKEENYSAQFAAFWRATRRAFLKCEVQQTYDETGEEELLSLFRAGKLTELRKMLEDDVNRSDSVWQQSLDMNVAFIRIHVFSLPLTEYLRFELEAYNIQAAKCERIWMVPAHRVDSADRAQLKDFMIFDTKRALVADYTASGSLTGATATDEPEDLVSLCSLRDRLIKTGIPWSEFWPDYLAGKYTHTSGN